MPTILGLFLFLVDTRAEESFNEYSISFIDHNSGRDDFKFLTQHQIIERNRRGDWVVEDVALVEEGAMQRLAFVIENISDKDVPENALWTVRLRKGSDVIASLGIGGENSEMVVSILERLAETDRGRVLLRRIRGDIKLWRWLMDPARRETG